MAKKYYVSKVAQPNGDHEVHDETCTWLPQPEHRTYLGYHESCYSAVIAARKEYYQVNGCRYCSPACHTQ